MEDEKARRFFSFLRESIRLFRRAGRADAATPSAGFLFFDAFHACSQAFFERFAEGATARFPACFFVLRRSFCM